RIAAYLGVAGLQRRRYAIVDLEIDAGEGILEDAVVAVDGIAGRAAKQVDAIGAIGHRGGAIRADANDVPGDQVIAVLLGGVGLVPGPIQLNAVDLIAADHIVRAD